MSFSCGCFVVPGGKVTPEMLRKHLLHTMEAMLFWEMLMRHSKTANWEKAKMKLPELRIEYTELVERLYPEAEFQEKDQATV